MIDYEIIEKTRGCEYTGTSICMYYINDEKRIVSNFIIEGCSNIPSTTYIKNSKMKELFCNNANEFYMCLHKASILKEDIDNNEHEYEYYNNLDKKLTESFGYFGKMYPRIFEIELAKEDINEDDLESLMSYNIEHLLTNEEKEMPLEVYVSTNNLLAKQKIMEGYVYKQFDKVIPIESERLSSILDVEVINPHTDVSFKYIYEDKEFFESISVNSIKKEEVCNEIEKYLLQKYGEEIKYEDYEKKYIEDLDYWEE